MTVVTQHGGPLDGRRVIRGQEKACAEHYRQLNSPKTQVLKLASVEWVTEIALRDPFLWALITRLQSTLDVPHKFGTGFVVSGAFERIAHLENQFCKIVMPISLSNLSLW